MTAISNNPEELREQGNQAFKQGKFSEAIDRYTEAINLLTNLQLNELTKCYSNRSQCYINLNQYEEAIEDATRGIISLDYNLIFDKNFST
jgi:tetratricopeptide (TPR) repeat protein